MPASEMAKELKEVCLSLSFRELNKLAHVARYFLFKQYRTIEDLSNLLSIVTGWYLHAVEMPIQKFLYSYPPEDTKRRGLPENRRRKTGSRA